MCYRDRTTRPWIHAASIFPEGFHPTFERRETATDPSRKSLGLSGAAPPTLRLCPAVRWATDEGFRVSHSSPRLSPIWMALLDGAKMYLIFGLSKTNFFVRLLDEKEEFLFQLTWTCCTHSGDLQWNWFQNLGNRKPAEIRIRVFLNKNSDFWKMALNFGHFENFCYAKYCLVFEKKLTTYTLVVWAAYSLFLWTDLSVLQIVNVLAVVHVNLEFQRVTGRKLLRPTTERKNKSQYTGQSLRREIEIERGWERERESTNFRKKNLISRRAPNHSKPGPVNWFHHQLKPRHLEWL